MDFVKRVVFDTSTLVSAVLQPGSAPRQALLKALAEAELCASPSTLAELESVLERDKFDRYLEREARRQFVTLYRRHTRMFPVSESEENTFQEPCRDPRDNKFLALALACSADAIISGDEDLLGLNPYRGIAVILARDYLQG
jgi:putative PIN family toxin of toxin-antitoxin system